MATKFTLQHTGYPVAGRAISPDEWKTLSTHTSENAAFRAEARACEHLTYGTWDDHYRVIAPDGMICDRGSWIEQQALREYDRFYRNQK